MTWIWKTSLYSYLYNTAVYTGQVFHCTLDSLQKYVLMRGLTRTLFEQFCKIMRAHIDNSSELPEGQVLSQVVTDIIQYTSQPISRQTPSIGNRSVAAHGVAIKQINREGITQGFPIQPSGGRTLLQVGCHRQQHGHDVRVHQIPVLRQLDIAFVRGFIEGRHE